ncbi:MAG: DUF5672 family protein [Azospirillaceae bacterium]|nr:DUF5672 family protein [Azospirillaceae bacterium]
MSDSVDLSALAAQQVAAGDDAIVESVLRRCLSVCPDHSAVLPVLAASLRTLATMTQQRERWVEATVLWRALARIDPGEAAALGALGDLSARTGDFSSGVRWYCRALTVDSDHPTGWSTLGTVAAASAAERLAFAAHRNAIVLAPDRGAGYASLGATLSASRPAAAEIAFKRAETIDPPVRLRRGTGVLVKMDRRALTLAPPRQSGALAIDPPAHPLAASLALAADQQWDAALAACPDSYDTDSRYLSWLLRRLTGGAKSDDACLHDIIDDDQDGGGATPVTLFHKQVAGIAAGDAVALLDLFAVDLALRPALRQRARPVDLPDTTLCCIDASHPGLALIALKNCRVQIRPAATVLVTDRAFECPGLTVVPARIASLIDYSQFVIKDLIRYVDTPFLLLVQWDGFVLDAGLWDERLRGIDYAGARWGAMDGPPVVGNGGFSWRSRRLLTALADPDVTMTHPEDMQISCSYRPLLEQRYGIRYASAEIADRFSQEYIDDGRGSFGFHGLARFHRVLDPGLAAAFLSRLPVGRRGGVDAVALAIAYANAGMSATAMALADIIRAAAPATPFRPLLDQLDRQCRRAPPSAPKGR